MSRPVHSRLGRKPSVQCEECGRDFNHLGLLQHHMARRHPKRHNHDGYRCKKDGCGQYFTRRRSLNDHLRRKHPKSATTMSSMTCVAVPEASSMMPRPAASPTPSLDAPADLGFVFDVDSLSLGCCNPNDILDVRTVVLQEGESGNREPGVAVAVDQRAAPVPSLPLESPSETLASNPENASGKDQSSDIEPGVAISTDQRAAPVSLMSLETPPKPSETALSNLGRLLTTTIEGLIEEVSRAPATVDAEAPTPPTVRRPQPSKATCPKRSPSTRPWKLIPLDSPFQVGVGSVSPMDPRLFGLHLAPSSLSTSRRGQTFRSTLRKGLHSSGEQAITTIPGVSRTESITWREGPTEVTWSMKTSTFDQKVVLQEDVDPIPSKKKEPTIAARLDAVFGKLPQEQ
ncbi:unnamed protein product [Owenia fusiformis]|uniref:Uncharacterized protein n=1 Tax=Owenia fusiformis TaxID=6347 RepID=A0A8J1Y3T2_OWEFU|nr:unnamed protein product [Owenia fusiformis]